MSGGEGNDRLTGQFGQDTFIHNPGDGRDRITDFDVNEDLLDLRGHGFANFADVQALFGDEAGGAFLNLGGADGILFEGLVGAAIGSEDVLI